MANIDINLNISDINNKRVRKFNKLTVTFVCTGNTCRSPIAECLMRDYLRRQGLCEKVRVMSAGVMADTAQSLSANSYKVLKNRGLRACKTRLAKQFQPTKHGRGWVITMTEPHKAMLIAYGIKRVWSARDCIGRDISDPYGGAEELYERAARDIAELVERVGDMIKTELARRDNNR